MSRASRTAEILAMAGLIPGQLEIERERSARDAARSTALASLLPSLIQTGAGIAGQVAASDLAERKFAADVTARKDRVGADTAKATADLEKTRAKVAADAVKAAKDARATNISTAAADVEREMRRQGMNGGVTQADLERAAVARGLPATEWKSVLDARDAAIDDTSAAAVKARQAAATARLAERKAEAPLGPAPKTEQQLADADARRTLTQLQIDRARQELSGEKPLAPSEDERKVQNNVDSMTKNIGKLEGDLSIVDSDGGFGPGYLSGPLREGFAKVFGDEAWTNFASTRDAVNLQIFGTLRSDAPSEAENEAAAGLKIEPNDKLETIRGKVRTIRALLDAKRRNPGSRLDNLIAGLRGASTAAPATVPSTTVPPVSFDSLPDAD
jgi:hypothetical protein